MDLNENEWLFFAPCPPPFASDLFYEQADLANLTRCDVEFIVTKCEIPPLSTTSATRVTTESFTTEVTGTQTVTSVTTDSSTEMTTGFTSTTYTESTSISNTTTEATTVSSAPISIPLITAGVVVAVVLILLLLLVFIGRWKQRKRTGLCCQSCCIVLKLSISLSGGCFHSFLNRRNQDKENSLVDLVEYVDDDSSFKVMKRGTSSDKTISYISFLDEEFKDLDFLAAYNAVEYDDTGNHPTANIATNLTDKGETNDKEKLNDGAKCKRQTSILKRSGAPRRTPTMKSGRRVRFSDDDQDHRSSSSSVSLSDTVTKENEGQTTSEKALHINGVVTSSSTDGYYNYSFEHESEDIDFNDKTISQYTNATIEAYDNNRASTSSDKVIVHKASLNILPGATAVIESNYENVQHVASAKPSNGSDKGCSVLTAKQNENSIGTDEVPNVMDYALRMLLKENPFHTGKKDGDMNDIGNQRSCYTSLDYDVNEGLSKDQIVSKGRVTETCQEFNSTTMIICQRASTPFECNDPTEGYIGAEYSDEEDNSQTEVVNASDVMDKQKHGKNVRVRALSKLFESQQKTSYIREDNLN